ncbi:MULTISPECIES: DarT ssDNA thymidine ADP-ribosyltransferase family protein [Gammaproteobacteria]|uniref:DarT ssDNA thymidine ADP-ribosyltransferase family protein n=1 Tax=Gammaproteobacteria TaxID=1236 RepID=UPI001270746B|nr:DarT ssDNA thymidine ADP-ribosyltransferase family protein [Vibrio navarrensis]EAQ4329572.1 DUF4433 domain-containing protein [Salmonella enterica]ECH1468073.1 DUF4433 domain-containing protein [Salmonella enterica subsp. enterica serovar Infantis]EIP3767966.1 DUF4433 domain-containing protein [Salmonella enterica subsp. enterica serovar Montevideo]HAS3626717.1 DUF4433 domain-containing protein [Vibrio cholerae]EBL7128800.1 DUF4433 domain-containing protein [Salmonella enterica]
MADIKTQKLLYHLTSLNNVSSIFKDGLKPRATLKEFHDVADQEIIGSRKGHELENYVPFHWFSRNPFDGRVQKDRPDEDFVLITVRREVAKTGNWKVIPRHPLANAAVRLYDYDEGFGLIDWDTMNKRDYHDPDCKSICMAECLSPSIVDISKFFMIYVPTTTIERAVVRELNGKSVDVNVNRGMFS